MHVISDLVANREFGAGIVAGVLAAAGCLVVMRVNDRRRRPGVLGVAFVAAALVAISVTVDGTPAPSPRLVLAFVVVGASGFVATRTAWYWAASVSLAGGLLLASAHGVPDVRWMRALLVCVLVVACPAARSLDRRGARLGVAPVLLLVALGGMYATVPDTDAVRAAIGALVPLTLLACPRAVATLGAAGAYAATAVAIWLAVVEGSARPGAVIGALGCLALLIGEPVGSALVDRVGWCARVNSGTSTLGPAPRVAVLVVLQFVFVLYAARVAGLQTNATRATLLLVPEVAAVVGAGVVFGIPRYGTAARRAQKGRI